METKNGVNKTFQKEVTNLKSWLDSNPPQEVQERVLVLINKLGDTFLRKALSDKQYKLKRIQNTVIGMKKLNMMVDPSIGETMVTLEAEIKILEKTFPPKAIKTVEKKEEAEEPANVKPRVPAEMAKA